MCDTYLYAYDYFPAGYEYEMVLEIEALDVRDIIHASRDELTRREVEDM